MKHNIKTFILKTISIAAVVILIFIGVPMLQSAIQISRFVDTAKDGNVVWLCEREYVDVSDETHLNNYEWQPVRYYGLTQGTELNMVVYGAWLIVTLIFMLLVMQVGYEIVWFVCAFRKHTEKETA